MAEDRQLADRPVALKISRTGSREPQTLARLQHTHIVPVHSYRTDPATGLHLLCMPYFGRVTLDQLLADDAVKKACTGADLLEVLDRLDPKARRDAMTTRSIFASLPFARAIASWGARMAEALAHAHERGVLHRDIKPSNVLVTADGLPMLLDFNLARDPQTKSGDPSMGGTLAYMSPEHLEALADGHDDLVDQRGDIYSLGVLLFEVLTGRRPFGMPTGATSLPEALRLAAQMRRQAVPRIRETHPEIPVALESVVRKCLAVDPNRRYATASALASDLQAVAEDAALIHAREPIVSRSIRFARRRRWPIALVGLLGLAWLFLANAVIRAREDQAHEVALVERWIDEGESLVKNGQLERAQSTFVLAAQLATKDRDFADQPIKITFRDRALEQLRQVNLTLEAQYQADMMLAAADGVRSKWGVRSDRGGLAAKIDTMLAPYLKSNAATQASRLDQARRERLKRLIEEFLFMRAILASGQGGDERLGSKLIALGLGVTHDGAPWAALSAWRDDKSSRVDSSRIGNCRDASACLLFGLLAEIQGQASSAKAWFKQADRLDPGVPGVPMAISRTSRE